MSRYMHPHTIQSHPNPNTSLFCTPELDTGHNHHYQDYLSLCSLGGERFGEGYESHIRGKGSHLAPFTKVYPGSQQLGNEAGINGPIYVSNPDKGPLIIIKPWQHFQGGRDYGYHHVHFRNI